MTLQQWTDNGWLRPHTTSPKEIANLINIVEYDYVGGATEADVNELISFVESLQHDVLRWLKKHHPEFVSF